MRHQKKKADRIKGWGEKVRLTHRKAILPVVRSEGTYHCMYIVHIILGRVLLKPAHTGHFLVEFEKGCCHSSR